MRPDGSLARPNGALTVKARPLHAPKMHIDSRRGKRIK
jgi:hypothetical protein